MKRSREGFSLLLVIGVLTAGALLASLAAQASRTDGLVASAISSQARLSAAADGALAWASFQLADTETEDPIVADGRPYTVTLGETIVTVRLVDETGLIDLNHASGDLLRAAFEDAGAAPILAERLSAQAQDWRDPDDQTRPLGAERRDYRDLPGTAFIANRAFTTVEELRALPAMTAALFDAARPVLTVAGTADPVRSLATPRVLAILDETDTAPGDRQPDGPAPSGRYSAYIEARNGSGAAFAVVIRFDIVADRPGAHILSRRRLSAGDASTAIEGTRRA